MGPFEFANTTVRSGARLREGLIAIEKSDKQGKLRGREGDLILIDILQSEGVIDFYEDVTYSVGRKWRSALCKMGFLFDHYRQSQLDIGPLDFITPNGKRLIEAESLAAQQESYLRAIAALQLQFNGRSFKMGPGFSPFKHISKIMLDLEIETGSTAISFIEFACFAQFNPELYGYDEILSDIKKYRSGRVRAENKKRYDTNALDRAVSRHGRVARSSYIDYADENLRYLKTTGCFTSSGRGIAIATGKKTLVSDLVRSIKEYSSYTEYWQTVTIGASLPTDSLEIAIRNLEELQNAAQSRGIPFKKIEEDSGIKEISNARYDLEEMIALNQELDYAAIQASKWEEILQYIAALLPARSLPPGLIQNKEIEIPRGEGPAYLEWAIWRAFLAINKLKNPPYESRKFRVDRDFLPITHAPGRGPDLVFEFDDYVLVVEVTLLTTDRQATAEQVSVRRHVYEIAKNEKSKPVYCLFLAPTIKNETARDFKSASYEEDDGSELNLKIIPLSLPTFMQVFATMLRDQEPDSQIFKILIDHCSQARKDAASTSSWMTAIESAFLSLID